MLHVPYPVVLFVVFCAAVVMALLNAGAYLLGRRSRPTAQESPWARPIDEVPTTPYHAKDPVLQRRLDEVFRELDAESAAAADARQHAIRIVK